VAGPLRRSSEPQAGPLYPDEAEIDALKPLVAGTLGMATFIGLAADAPVGSAASSSATAAISITNSIPLRKVAPSRRGRINWSVMDGQPFGKWTTRNRDAWPPA